MDGFLDWRPIVGCTPISPGCANCAGLPAGMAWSGALRLELGELDLPARTAAPHTVGVCINSDLFHEALPDAWIDAVFDQIEAAPHHPLYSILTKRSARMLAYVRRRYPAAMPANVHLGVSVERQAEARVRLADLVQTPPGYRFAVFYPLLGRIACDAYLAGGAVHYVVAGEELQRPARPSWFGMIEASCRRHAVAYMRRDRIVA